MRPGCPRACSTGHRLRPRDRRRAGRRPPGADGVVHRRRRGGSAHHHQGGAEENRHGAGLQLAGDRDGPTPTSTAPCADTGVGRVLGPPGGELHRRAARLRRAGPIFGGTARSRRVREASEGVQGRAGKLDEDCKAWAPSSPRAKPSASSAGSPTPRRRAPPSTDGGSRGGKIGTIIPPTVLGPA